MLLKIINLIYCVYNGSFSSSDYMSDDGKCVEGNGRDLI
jgi:hypothetical protein